MSTCKILFTIVNKVRKRIIKVKDITFPEKKDQYDPVEKIENYKIIL